LKVWKVEGFGRLKGCEGWKVERLYTTQVRIKLFNFTTFQLLNEELERFERLKGLEG